VAAAIGAVLLAFSAAAQPLTVPQITGVRNGVAGVSLAWAASGADQAYTVQMWDGTGSPFWITPRVEFPWPLRATQWLDTGLGDATRRFYRVAAVAPARRGSLLAVTEVGVFDRAYINFGLFVLGIPWTASYSVHVVKLDYETIDPQGGRTVASGAFALPLGTTKSLPLASYQHGTLAKRDEAPSVSETEEQFFGIVMAGFGYLAAMPDYLGLGDSPGVHPYHHAASEATAAVDMLRAVRAFCAANGVALNGQLFLVGYSQGGHATAALHRELEEYHASEFTVTASAPMAGAYDLSGVTLEDALSGRPMPHPYYFALLLAGYQSVYHLADSLADLLAPPYHTTLPPMLDGQHTGSEIDAVMPDNITRLVRPDYLAELRQNPRNPLRQALYQNDLYRWTPRAPLRLYHCAADADVIYANSVVAFQAFQARGATQVKLLDPLSTGDHGSCVLPSLIDAKRWFDSFRQ
jgi:hypothetical protein